MNCNTAEDVLNRLIQCYYEARDVEAVLDCVTEDIEWIGTENNDSASGKIELRALLENDVRLFPAPFHVELSPPTVQTIGDDAVLFAVSGRQNAVPGLVCGFGIRGTALAVRTAQGWRIRHVHTSVPNAEPEKFSLEKALNEKQLREKTLLAGIRGGVAIYRMKKDGRFGTDYVTDGVARIFGWDDTDAFMRYYENDAVVNIPEEERPRFRSAMQKSLETHEPVSVICRSHVRGHEDILQQLDANLIEGELNPDDVAIWYAVHTIVSEDVIRAKTEQDYYRTILNMTNTTYFELDAAGHFYSSESFSHYKVSEYGEATIAQGKHADKCFHPDDLKKVTGYLHSIARGEQGTSVIARMAMKDGSYQWTEITAYVDFDSLHAIRRMTGVMRDVNLEWKRQKASLEQALAAAEQANRAKTDFLSRISHDMRTPLNGILGLTTLLKDSVTDTQVLRDLNELEMSGRYLLDLINDTLDMSRIESGHLELHPAVYDGREMFDNALSLVKTAIKGKNLKLIVHADNIPSMLLYVDVSRFEQIIMNVFGNAVKFTPEGGMIELSMTNLSVRDGTVVDRLTVRDTGVGISPEFLPHIFEAFSQEDASRTSTAQGTGLGMAITKQLVERMGGTIDVESEQGKGTCFTILFKLPIATEEQIAEWKRASHDVHDGAKLSGKRVLLCEDHPLNAQIATRLLTARGMLVERTENGLQAVERFRAAPEGYYDAILMDIRMPVMDGLEATKLIRALPWSDAHSVPILAMTANAFAEDIEQTRAAGMNGHISKPIETKVLYRTLSEAMNVRQETRRARVLVVDDVEVNRAVIRVSLEQDYEVLEASNGEEAMLLIENVRGLEAVITDIQMPQMDGIELIRRIRANPALNHIVIIANTQFGDPEQEEELLALGANDFVYKPTTSKIIEIRVRNALRRV